MPNPGSPLPRFTRCTILAAALIVAALPCAARAAEDAPIQLSDNGETVYRIVRPAQPSDVDTYVADELRSYLTQITGAEFQVIAPTDVQPDGRYIFVGDSKPMRNRLDQNPFASLDAQEHVARSAGKDIFLYGQGVHGNLNAVFDFLEHSMGWRWYSLFEHPVVPSRPTVTLDPFHREKGFDFLYRLPDFRRRNRDFPYQHGRNRGYGTRQQKTREYNAEVAEEYSHFQPAIPEFGRGHSLLLYIPPHAGQNHGYDWVEKKNYFETNPDYFTLAEKGERVPDKQLCFSNDALRAELTKNIYKHIERAGGDERQIIIKVGANDTPGHFCYCDDCQALEGKYQSPGGPIYDYLLELCRKVEQDYPKVMLWTFGYRKEQTQIPPTMPSGQTFPDNLIVSFAPIDDNYFGDWWHHRDPELQQTYKDMRAWGQVVDHLWAWIYPNPWGSGLYMPLGNIERLVNNIRLMHYAGVEGLFVDHNGDRKRAAFSELQNYLILKLMQDVDRDVDQLVHAFTDNIYGAAAPLMRGYINELETYRKNRKDLPEGVRYKSRGFTDHLFPYLTLENIHRWQQLFDRMEQRVSAGSKRVLNNISYVRRELDYATLWKWTELAERYPDTYTDHQVIVDRIEAMNNARPQPWMNDGKANRTEWEKKTGKRFNRMPLPMHSGVVSDFVVMIQAGGEEKPLPARFDGIDRGQIETFVPSRGERVLDDNAAFGYAIAVQQPDQPFNFGFYQADRATRNEKALRELPDDTKGTWQRALNGKFTLQRALPANAADKTGYQVHQLGEVEITPRCNIWFSAQSWATHVDLGKRLYEPGEENLWDAYVSVKFVDGGERVLVDRVILVKQ